MPSAASTSEVDPVCDDASMPVQRGVLDSLLHITMDRPSAASHDLVIHPEFTIPSPAVGTSPPSTSNTDQLLVENTKLKESIAQLSNRYKDILDHSSESNQQFSFTDQMFTVPGALDSCRTMCADFAVQCEIPWNTAERHAVPHCETLGKASEHPRSTAFN